MTASTFIKDPIVGVVTFDSQENQGQFQDRLEIFFFDTLSRRRFAIVKPLSAIVGNKEDYELLKPIAPYEPLVISKREVIKEIIPGEHPPSAANAVWVRQLEQYKISKAFKTVLDMVSMGDKLRMIRAGFMPRQLTTETHARWFHALLHIEEHQSE